MPRLFIAALSVAVITLIFAHTVLLDSGAQSSPKELTVVTKTEGHEELKATLLDNQVRIRLKNNHRETITAFAINFKDTTIKVDFAYSDVHFGIEPGETFEKDYPVSPTLVGSEISPLHLVTVLFKDRTNDGDSKVAQEIQDQRLGEKIQILRTLRILEKEGQASRDLQITKNDVVAALDSGESETRNTLNELAQPARISAELTHHLRSGLQVGREKMLRKFEVLEQLPPESRQQGFMELKDRLSKLFAKL